MTKAGLKTRLYAPPLRLPYELTNDVRKDAAVLEGDQLLWRIDPDGDRELARRAVGKVAGSG